MMDVYPSRRSLCYTGGEHLSFSSRFVLGSLDISIASCNLLFERVITYSSRAAYPSVDTLPTR